MVTADRAYDQLESALKASSTVGSLVRECGLLDADLSISKRFLAEANDWKNSGYTVTKAYSVKLDETQTTMNFFKL
jgi:hypothetical protein